VYSFFTNFLFQSFLIFLIFKVKLAGWFSKINESMLATQFSGGLP
jgi:hypothetical protein